MQNMLFSRLKQVTNKSLRPVARVLKTKILKIFLCFSRLEVLSARESWHKPRKSLCTLRDKSFHPQTSHQTEPREILKTQNFEKYSKYFLRLGHWLASKLRKIFVWVRDWGVRLDQPTTESPEQGYTVFEDFDNFCKNNILSKNN